MTLLEEIIKREEDLFLHASLSEKAFYKYFLNEEFRIDKAPNGEIDRVCIVAFTTNFYDVSQEIKRAINTSPIKGLHFSNNLISILAFATLSKEIKQQYLNSYFSSHSLVDKFFITRKFPEFILDPTCKPKNIFEQVIFSIFIDKDYGKGEASLLKGLQETNDLIELLVIKLAYFELVKIHPNSIVEEKYNELSIAFSNLIYNIRVSINAKVNISLVIIGFILAPSIIFLTRKYWDDWNLEPLITGASLAFPIITVILIILFKTNPDWFKIGNKYKEQLLIKWFARKGIDVELLKKYIIKEKDI